MFSEFVFNKACASYSFPSHKLYKSYPLTINQKKLDNVQFLAEKYVPKNDQWYYNILFNAVGPEIPQENLETDDEEAEVEMF